MKTKSELQKSLKNPIKGKEAQILERLGESFRQSGNLYKDCITPGNVSSELLGQFDMYLQNTVNTGEHILLYKKDKLLISIDDTFYEIDSQDLKGNTLKLAKNAGVPFEFIGQELGKLIEGIVKLWKKYDQLYSDTNRLIN